MSKERCSAELHLEKYFGFESPGEETEIITADYGQFVNMLVMYRESQLSEYKEKLKQTFKNVGTEFDLSEVLTLIDKI